MATTSKKVVTGKVRASYVNVFQPRLNEMNGEHEYSMMLIIDKGDTETVNLIQGAAQLAAKDKWNGKIPGGIRMPLRDADAEAQSSGDPVAPHLKGKLFMNIRCKEKPQVVDKDLMTVIDPTEFQSGDYCRVSMGAFAYDVKGNKGVSFGLNNIQVVGKGEPLSSRARAEDDFGAYTEDGADDDWAA